MRLDIHEKLRVTFMPAAEMPADDAEDEEGAEVAADDLDTFAFDGEVIELEPLLREQFVLSLPYAPLCREDCKGLCPTCGTNLNESTCNCTPSKTDSRWDALLKHDSKSH